MFNRKFITINVCIIYACCTLDIINGIERPSLTSTKGESDRPSDNIKTDIAWIMEQLKSTLPIVCPFGDFCHNNSSGMQMLPDAVPCCKDCSCDRECGNDPNTTCCFPDDNTTSERSTTLQMQCIPVKSNNSVLKQITPSPSYYMVVDCLDDFPESSREMEISARRCREKFIWSVQPVFSKTTKLIYKNKYCAQCHGIFNFISWTPNLICIGDSFVVDITMTSLSPNCYIHLQYPGALIDIQHHRCCRDNLIFSFPLTDLLTRNGIISLCESGFYAPYRYIDNEFANIFCLMCSANVSNHKLHKICKKTVNMEHFNSGTFLGILDTRTLESVAERAKEEITRRNKEACRTLMTGEQECREIVCPSGQLYNKDRQCVHVSMHWKFKVIHVQLKLSPHEAFLDCSLADFIENIELKSHLKNTWPMSWEISDAFVQTTPCNCSDRVKRNCVSYFGATCLINYEQGTKQIFLESIAFLKNMVTEDWYLLINGTSVRLASQFLDLSMDNETALWYLKHGRKYIMLHLYKPSGESLMPITKLFYCEQIRLLEDDYVLYNVHDGISDYQLIYIKDIGKLLLPTQYSFHTRTDGTVFPQVCLSDTSFHKMTESISHRQNFMTFKYLFALQAVMIMARDVCYLS